MAPVPKTIARIPVGMAISGIQKKSSVVTPQVMALAAPRYMGR